MHRLCSRLGCGSLDVVNVFGLVDGDPKGLTKVYDPIGPGNDQAILDAVSGADLVVCAWSEWIKYQNRESRIKELLKDTPLHVLRLTYNGVPWHPLYLPRKLKPQRWEISSGFVAETPTELIGIQDSLR